MQPTRAKTFQVGLGARERRLKPVRSGYKHYPLVAFDGAMCMTENGEVMTMLDYINTSPPSIVVTTYPHILKQVLEDHFPLGDFRISGPRPNTKGGPSRAKSYFEKFDPFVRGKGKSQRRMYVVWHPEGMDPTLRPTIIGRTLPELMTFGLDVRGWLEAENLPVKPKLTGMAGRLFRDGRFWPEGKAIVPTFTNDIGREHLPGGYVRTFAPIGREYARVLCYDQNGSYHAAAVANRLPDATELYARGHYQNPDSTQPAIAGETMERFLQTQVGLVKVKLANGPTGRARFYPEKLHEAFGPDRIAQGIVYLWTNEIDIVEEAGASIEYLIAAWTSPADDTGYRAYGAYALEQLAAAEPDRKRWLKPTLHMVHGLGAARASSIQYGVHPASRKGVESAYWLGPKPVDVREIASEARALPTTNTLALGIMQAHTLSKTCELANAMQSLGYTVLHTHTDSVHIDYPGHVPGVPEGWKVESYTDVVYENEVWFRSNEKMCHPGQRRACP